MNPRLSLRYFTALLAAVGTGWIVFLMVLICGDIIGRAAFDSPILGVPEILQFSIVGIVFLQLPQTLYSGGMTRSEALLGLLSGRAPRLVSALQGLFHATGAVLFSIIFLTTWPLMKQAFKNKDFYGTIGFVEIPTGPLKIIILIGCATITTHFILLAYADVRRALSVTEPKTKNEGALGAS